MTGLSDTITIDRLLLNYRQLIEGIDRWFSACLDQFPEQIKCAAGCSACCRGLFEISLLDAALLQQGFRRLSQEVQQTALNKAKQRLAELQQQWPELVHPYILNRLPHNDWEEMPEDDPTPCPLLGEDGSCLVYKNRPLICRLHGLPNIDLSGRIFMADYCTLNFPGLDAAQNKDLRHCFHATYQQEFDLLGEFSELVLGERNLEIDTFIPLALLIQFAAIGYNSMG